MRQRWGADTSADLVAARPQTGPVQVVRGPDDLISGHRRLAGMIEPVSDGRSHHRHLVDVRLARVVALAQAEENRLLSLAATKLGEDRLAESFQLTGRAVRRLPQRIPARPPRIRVPGLEIGGVPAARVAAWHATVGPGRRRPQSPRAARRCAPVDCSRARPSSPDRPEPRQQLEPRNPRDVQRRSPGRPPDEGLGKAGPLEPIRPRSSSADQFTRFPGNGERGHRTACASAHGPRRHAHPDRVATSKPPAVISVPGRRHQLSPASGRERSRPAPAVALRAEHLQEVCGLCWLASQSRASGRRWSRRTWRVPSGGGRSGTG